MSTPGSGYDVFLDVPRDGFRLRLLLYVLLNHWPDAVFQRAEEDRIQRLRDVIEAAGRLEVDEFFVYRDKASARSWDREGLTLVNSDRMLHILIEDQSPRPDFIQITVVMGALTPELLRLYNSLDSVLRSPSPTGNGLRPGGSAKLDTALKAIGLRLTRRQFHDLVNEVRRSLYPEWTEDELACHPHDALQFCEVVRLRAEAPLPDNVIMRALFSARKRKGRL